MTGEQLLEKSEKLEETEKRLEMIEE